MNEGEGVNIPEGEFKFVYGSEEWFQCYLAHTVEFGKQESRDARQRALHNGLPKNHPKLLGLIQGIAITRDTFARKGNALLKIQDFNSLSESERHKLIELGKELRKLQDDEREFTQELGEIIANGLLNGDSTIPGDLGKVLNIVKENPFPSLGERLGMSFNGNRQTGATDILQAYSRLISEWFPNDEAFPLVTKASVREQVFGKNPNDVQMRDFTAKLKELGLSKLPERGVGKKS